MFRRKMKLAVIIIMPMIGNLVHANEVVFIGSGEETDSVNELLIYPGIESSQLNYNLGNKRTFLIRYGKNIDAKTFVAKIGTKDISKRFHPVADTEENVYLTLKRGENELSISISNFGDLSNGNESKTDNDIFNIELDGPIVSANHISSPPPGIEKIELPPQASSNSKRPVFIDGSKR